MDEQVLKVYAEIEEIKKKAVALGYAIGEVKITEDLPYIKISIDLMKRLEDGTDTTERISEEADRDSKILS